MERSNKDLHDEVKSLKDNVKLLTAMCHNDKWMMQGMLSHMEAMEARQSLFMKQLGRLNPAPIMVDLTWEEDQGGIRGPISLAPPTPLVSESQEEREEAQRELIYELDTLLANFTWYEEETVGGEYTPMRPSAWGPEF